MKSEVTKVTYIMYSYDTCYTSREMIKMDGRDSAKCQKSKIRGIISIIEMFNDNKDKTTNSIVSYLKRPKEKT